MIIMPMSPSMKRFRLVEKCWAPTLGSIQSAILRTWTKAALISGPSRAFLSRFMMAARYAVGLMPASEASNFCPSSGRVPPLAMG